jgi:putative NADH-flavin reductase
MNLTIFGATGKTGFHLVEQALAAGHSITALARTPAKMTIHHERLQVIQGDAVNAAQVAQAIGGSEAVVSGLAQDSQFITNLLSGMKAHGVRRILVAAGAGVPDPADQPTALNHFISFVIKTLSRKVYEEALLQNDLLRNSDTDWTIVRAPMLTDQPGGAYWVGYVGKEMGRTLSRATLARFMLAQITDKRYVHQAPVVTDSK